MREFQFSFGVRAIMEDPHEKGHYLWASSFGWHDCHPSEDRLIADTD